MRPPARRDRPRRHAAALRPHGLGALAGGDRRRARGRDRGGRRDGALAARALADSRRTPASAASRSARTARPSSTSTPSASCAHAAAAGDGARARRAGSASAIPGIVFGWEHELRFGSEPAYEALREPEWWPRPEGSYDPCDPLDWELPMTKLLARLPGADLEQLLAVAAELAGTDASTTLAGTAFVELLAARRRQGERARSGSQPSAGSPREEVVAFGDHLTDAGHGRLGRPRRRGRERASGGDRGRRRGLRLERRRRRRDRARAAGAATRASVTASRAPPGSVGEQRVGRRVVVGQERDVVERSAPPSGRGSRRRGREPWALEAREPRPRTRRLPDGAARSVATRITFPTNSGRGRSAVVDRVQEHRRERAAVGLRDGAQQSSPLR